MLTAYSRTRDAEMGDLRPALPGWAKSPLPFGHLQRSGDTERRQMRHLQEAHALVGKPVTTFPEHARVRNDFGPNAAHC